VDISVLEGVSDDTVSPARACHCIVL